LVETLTLEECEAIGEEAVDRILMEAPPMKRTSTPMFGVSSRYPP
jgi:hypothetical protein